MDLTESRSTKSEVEELKTALTTVTEALILFQEFIEAEIGVMAYFRDSGCHKQLVETLDQLRSKALRVAGPYLKKPVHDTPWNCMDKSQLDTDEEEQVEVDVNYNEDEEDSIDENVITISEVYSISRSPPKNLADNLLMRNNSALTITPVFPHVEEKKKEPQKMFVKPPAIMRVEKNVSLPPPPPFPILTANAPFMLVDRQTVIPGMKLELNGDGRIFSTTNNNFAIGAQVPAPAQLMGKTENGTASNFQNSTAQQLYLAKGKKASKKSLLRVNNPNKKNNGNGERHARAQLAAANTVASVDRPLDLKKKKPVKCEKCNRRYSSKGVMSRHMKEAHNPNNPQFPCFYCGIKFKNGPERLLHMSTDHSEDMNSVTCPYCDKKSNSVTGKRNHMMLCVKKRRNPAMAMVLSPTDSGVGMEVSA